MNVFDIIDNSAESWPHQPAIIDEYGSLDYQGLRQEVNEVRNKLLKLGVCQGQGIGVMGKNGRAFIISAFAALGCGATVLPISPKLKKYEVDLLFKTTRLHGVLFSGKPSCLIGGSSSEIAIGDVSCMQFMWIKTNDSSSFTQLIPDAAFVRFTSGTTGKSKGVVLSHRTVFERTEAANKALKLSSDDTVLWVLPMAFHFFVSIVLYLRYGAAIVISPDHFAETILELTNQHNATFLYAAPLHYRLLAANTSGVQFETLQRAISTSISLPIQIARDFWGRYHIPITQAYGIIEVGLPLINLDRSVEKPGSVGKALPDYDVKVLDDNLVPINDGSMGQLGIKGPGMFDAYLDPFLRRCDVLRNGWFLTGDLACQDKDGSITIVGRSKSMINVGGNKVFPEEVETVIDQHPLVRMSRVSAKPHPQLGEVVHVDIACCKQSEDIDIEELLTFCRARLASFKVPQTVAFVENIEKTTSGKVTRC
jgi:long-chain acyl-CoA synthetase